MIRENQWQRMPKTQIVKEAATDLHGHLDDYWSPTDKMVWEAFCNAAIKSGAKEVNKED